MIKHLNNGYANNSRDCIELFLSLCENCNMKMYGAPKIVKTSIKLKATSEAFFEVSGLILQKIQHLIKELDERIMKHFLGNVQLWV
jgi:hypothetical protein